MKVYLDNSATTKVDEAVFEKMKPYFCEIYGNANSLHSFGRAADKAVAEARQKLANAIGAKKNEVYFTSGGTESDNWAIRGAAYRNLKKGNHIISSKIEHAAVIQLLRGLEKSGFEVTYIDVDKDGIIDLEQLKKAITPKTMLISIMAANNEIGTLQPIREIAQIANEYKVYFHTDAVQAFGNIEIDVKDLGVDFMSLSAHKIYGPKGVGALYIKSGVVIDKQLVGGHQERTMRGGTSNVPGIVGFGFAAEEAANNLSIRTGKIRNLRDYFVDRVFKEIPDIIYNGHKTKRLSGNANFSFKGIEGESILQRLDLNGIAVSTGSACSSGSLEPSHVLLAIGVPIEHAHGSIRFSFGKYNTREEADYTIEKLKAVVKSLRDLSPLYVQLEGDMKNV